MTVFEVALSGDFRRADGSLAYPDFDLGPLEGDPRIRLRWVQPVENAMPAAGLEDVDALILLGARFVPSSVPASRRLAVVARFGVGYDSVDVPACTAADIALVTTPDGVRRPVAVAILTFVLALAGKLFTKDALVRRGPDGWAERSQHMGTGLVGRTLGQLGIGNIGAEVFRMAAPFDMRFIAHDPFADPALASRLGVELVDLETLFRDSDFLSVSCPLSEATRHIVDAERLALMKPTAYLVNTSRGPVVDQQALYQVLRDRRIAGAGLDVFEQEPTPPGEPITTLDNVMLAPHALCWTDQCFAGIGAADVAAVLEVMEGRVPRGIVNREVVEALGWKAKLRTYGDRFGSA
ncbi:MAG: NAD(P)-dependent oxidoreductase [Pseudomonadota bacterium]